MIPIKRCDIDSKCILIEQSIEFYKLCQYRYPLIQVDNILYIEPLPVRQVRSVYD